MSGGIIFHTWRGPGDTWPSPSDPTAEVISANRKSRYMPFLDKVMQRMISSGGPKNQSGTSWENAHAGVKSAAIPETFGKM
jgi:hypothetical protein